MFPSPATVFNMTAAIFSLLLVFILTVTATPPNSDSVCIIGSGIGGSSLVHFLRQFDASPFNVKTIRMFDRNGVVGGRMRTITIAGETFEAGASILHPKNYHFLNFKKLLDLKIKEPSSSSEDDSFSLGIWDGHKFLFKTLGFRSSLPFVQKIVNLANSVLIFARYGLSLFRMNSFVERMVGSFLNYYKSFEERPAFETVDEMLKWAGLYNITKRTLHEELVDAAVSPLLIHELATVDACVVPEGGGHLYMSSKEQVVSWTSGYVQQGAMHKAESQKPLELLKDFLSGLRNIEATWCQLCVQVITRINYGQSMTISGLAGAVSLAGSGADLWSIEGGNWQVAVGLINNSNVTLHLHEEIESITNLGEYYELTSSNGNSYNCQITVIATPLDEVNIAFTPSISIPERKLQHTHATFVRGLLNPVYFGLNAVSEIPELVATIEDPKLTFTSISVLKKHDEKDYTYKIFSRQPMADADLDLLFSVRKETARIDWGAYPLYNAPEVFAPFMLDNQHLYYINAFENAASTMETMAVAAENIARLIISRLSGQVLYSPSILEEVASDKDPLHLDL
ncbi:Prenylcysteine lyase [Dillenia turbinata]|uniref:Prenylcysteine lyase n=1 Tax=Dillenia turbinata TaxID=194707 RepID=A0AAN8VAP2_9MAGN